MSFLRLLVVHRWWGDSRGPSGRAGRGPSGRAGRGPGGGAGRGPYGAGSTGGGSCAIGVLALPMLALYALARRAIGSRRLREGVIVLAAVGAFATAALWALAAADRVAWDASDAVITAIGSMWVVQGVFALVRRPGRDRRKEPD